MHKTTMRTSTTTTQTTIHTTTTTTTSTTTTYTSTTTTSTSTTTQLSISKHILEDFPHCGEKGSANKVIGGTQIHENEYPWLCSLRCTSCP